MEHPKENNLKVEEVNHEQNLDSVYESSEFKHDICKKYWKKNLFELHRAKTNEVQYSCSGDLIKHASEAYEKIRYPCENVKFSVISVSSYYSLELFRLRKQRA